MAEEPSEAAAEELAHALADDIARCVRDHSHGALAGFDGEIIGRLAKILDLPAERDSVRCGLGGLRHMPAVVEGLRLGGAVRAQERRGAKRRPISPL
ncbi:hypothetical protein CCAX7_000860 [Capsulimonas corticalis]|uniref:Uncharacterized protein n=1 Tax=Capsulimonas corticalis TaxID=2219043 RepID=A0A402CR99_9BACT|nr:hypothetical protein CCAX7_000860 [Capsulimonas corticalis]